MRFRGRAGKKGFRVLVKVFCAIGRIEAFWKDDEICALFRGFEDFGARVGEVLRFIGPTGELDESESQGLF